MLRHSDQVRELLAHDVATTDAAMHDPFVQNAPEVRRIILQHLNSRELSKPVQGKQPAVVMPIKRLPRQICRV